MASRQKPAKVCVTFEQICAVKPMRSPAGACDGQHFQGEEKTPERFMKTHYQILQVEDCAIDAALNLRQLRLDGLDAQCERVETAAQMRSALEGKAWDFILCDYQLPQFDVLSALALYNEAGSDVPFIVVSGRIGETQAVK